MQDSNNQSTWEDVIGLSWLISEE